ncbi:hypothetical protein JVT61DRAFT_2556 [Boletus reticuloceps]|uniref:Uncharacterized protein n=1 Tax=Boletus reticuloceps TaxID=495285 RepID=A0A8I2YBV3_9AGAM|nr:hypothetical protein JVT61DRAFT_2556 [Boletus reticuloceps]
MGPEPTGNQPREKGKGKAEESTKQGPDCRGERGLPSANEQRVAKGKGKSIIKEGRATTPGTEMAKGMSNTGDTLSDKGTTGQKKGKADGASTPGTTTAEGGLNKDKGMANPKKGKAGQHKVKGEVRLVGQEGENEGTEEGGTQDSRPMTGEVKYGPPKRKGAKKGKQLENSTSDPYHAFQGKDENRAGSNERVQGTAKQPDVGPTSKPKAVEGQEGQLNAMGTQSSIPRRVIINLICGKARDQTMPSSSSTGRDKVGPPRPKPKLMKKRETGLEGEPKQLQGKDRYLRRPTPGPGESQQATEKSLAKSISNGNDINEVPVIYTEPKATMAARHEPPVYAKQAEAGSDSPHPVLKSAMKKPKVNTSAVTPGKPDGTQDGPNTNHPALKPKSRKPTSSNAPKSVSGERRNGMILGQGRYSLYRPKCD